MSQSPEYTSDMNAETQMLSIPIDTPQYIRRSGRQKSAEPTTPTRKFKKVKPTSLRLPRGVQRQSRNGAAYSGWVTVDGYRLLGPARPSAELASEDRRRLAEAKLIGGLPEARKVIQQLHAEVASSRRFRSQHLIGQSYMNPSSSMNRVATRSLPTNVACIVPCGAGSSWSMRYEKQYASYTVRSDVEVARGIFVFEFGTIRQSIEEARRDASTVNHGSLSSPEQGDVSVKAHDMALLGSNSSGSSVARSHSLGDSVWGYCAVAELTLENRPAFVGLCIFCDVALTAGPCRGSRSSAESDAFSMVGDVLASGISYAAEHHVLPVPNPAEDLFITQIQKEESLKEEGETEEDNMITDEDGEEEDEDEFQNETPTTTGFPLNENWSTTSNEDNAKNVDLYVPSTIA